MESDTSTVLTETKNIFLQNDSDSDTCFDLKRDNDSEERVFRNSSTESENDSGLDSGYDSDEEIYIHWNNLDKGFKEKILKLKNYKDEKKFLKEYNIGEIPLTYFYLSKKVEEKEVEVEVEDKEVEDKN